MPLETSRIQAVFFDIDGTLRDTDDQYVQRISRLLWPLRYLIPSGKSERGAGGVPAALARWTVMALESPGNLYFEISDRLGIDGYLDSLATWLHFRRHAGRNPSTLIIAGVQEMLANLSTRYPLAVITSRGAHATQCFLDEFELAPYFQVIVNGLTCQHTKPYPDPILYAASAIGVAPQACLMVGDTAVDIGAGRAASAQTLGVLCGFGQEKELRRKGADLIIARTPDILDYL